MRPETTDKDRFLISLGLVAVSLLWLTVARNAWMTGLCWTGALLGAAGAVRFGWLRRRATRSEES
ncbi:MULTISPECIES: hypothetical protein [Streptomyces]|uniref:hypothetical protein n=1 Tax=Streptomyces TaxID=1883 RepID=UPI00031CBEFE|nr:MULTISPECIES: hypothetical protein [unclassified Streptomyces]QPA00953.1 hypothetical protein DI273_19730 [Streptomyces violascens]WSB20748.1 hypothetical protein OHB02_11220 [Streptomyces albidoflavus]ESP97674.1 Hypothetical protein B591_19073 [Streptomyces sp. GBA 94-10 4N24]ESQ04333.1 Hypothetical protein B590_18894 [Streptomyces sp. PVA_94-07]RPK70915.1 hypothetical protein EES44_04475 [Streptomyces sp. ADI96-15]